MYLMWSGGGGGVGEKNAVKFLLLVSNHTKRVRKITCCFNSNFDQLLLIFFIVVVVDDNKTEGYRPMQYAHHYDSNLNAGQKPSTWQTQAKYV